MDGWMDGSIDGFFKLDTQCRYEMIHTRYFEDIESISYIRILNKK